MEPRRPTAVIDRDGLDQLVKVLQADGYTVVGPTVRDGAIVLGELADGTDLPDGVGAETGPGRYRLRRRDDGAVFNHAAGPQSWKRFVHPVRQRVDTPEAPRHLALLGVRPCDLAALRVLDGVFGAPIHPDRGYQARRDRLFVIAVNCVEPGATCFCASTGTGPEATCGYDLVITELFDHGHRFLIAPDTAEGDEILDRLVHRDAATEETAEADEALRYAKYAMERALPEIDLRGLLRRNLDADHWRRVGDRCLGCANCTMVCPTCFCTTVEDVTDLDGANPERWRRWDTCFDLDFSYTAGRSVRTSTASRYRQWMTHKLGTWHDQFGTSGCVGCGRCIAWCPAGIDITAEAAALAAAEEAPR